jgi:dual specificity phosphatase 12
MLEADLHEVLPGLWLGSQAAAAELDVLQSRGISHVVCLGSEAFHLENTAFTYLQFPQLLDLPTANLLGVLDAACAFISEARQQQHSVFVHCVYGQSRGPAVCAAYLIRSTGSTVAVAAMQLTRVRPAVQINAGFVAQLQLWQSYSMQCSSTAYDDAAATTAAATARWFLYAIGSSCSDQLVTAAAAATTVQQRRYVCRKCRHALFTSSNIIEHSHAIVQLVSTAASAATGYTAVTEKPNSTMNIQRQQACTSIFIEPVDWCNNVSSYGTDKLMCPGNCGSKVGAYDGKQGLVCSCGARVKPAFQMISSKVEIR